MSSSYSRSTSASKVSGPYSNTDILRKRRRDDNYEGGLLPSSKRQRKLDRLKQRLKEQSQDLDQALKELEVYLEHPGLKCGAKLLVPQLRRQCDLIKSEKLPLSLEIPFASSLVLKGYFNYDSPDSLPMGGEVCYQAMIIEAQAALDNLGVTFKKLLRREKCPPSASSFAKVSVWPIWQSKEDTTVLNLRPHKNQDIPLAAFHTLFSRFIATVHAKNPSSQLYTAAAFRAAHELCTLMGTPFSSDRERRDIFYSCLKDLFPQLQTDVLIESTHPMEMNKSKAGLYLQANGYAILIGEVKHEFEGGDAYIQVSREYQALVHKYEHDAWAKRGIPCLLVSLNGPLITISGGFFDGKSTVIEPLAEPCLMLPDYTMKRQEQLATLLFAMKEAVETLSYPSTQIPPLFPPSTPRIYSQFRDVGGKWHNLSFANRLIVGNSMPPLNLLFIANSPARSGIELLVKLVEPGKYGVDAHRTLARFGFAPAFVGLAEVQGAPTAVVMERLRPVDRWVTLHEYVKTHVGIINNRPARLTQLLGVMMENKIVHGDLRPCNIMVRENGVGNAKGLEVKVIDFDWAGTLGVARYPWVRNEIIPWPGKPGDLIQVHDDSTLLSRTLVA